MMEWVECLGYQCHNLWLEVGMGVYYCSGTEDFMAVDIIDGEEELNECPSRMWEKEQDEKYCEKLKSILIAIRKTKMPASKEEAA